MGAQSFIARKTAEKLSCRWEDGLAGTEKVLFSPRLITVYNEHVRLVSGLLRQNYAMTYSAFTLLCATHTISVPVSVEQLADMLLLKKRTVLDSLLALENHGLVVKSGISDDNRKMSISLSAKGHSLARRVFDDALSFVREVFWEGLPDSDYIQFHRAATKGSVDLLRGHVSLIAGDCQDDAPPVPPVRNCQIIN
jgi:DNA-binding MarR family transcriptional regulator